MAGAGTQGTTRWQCQWWTAAKARYAILVTCALEMIQLWLLAGCVLMTPAVTVSMLLVLSVHIAVPPGFKTRSAAVPAAATAATATAAAAAACTS